MRTLILLAIFFLHAAPSARAEKMPNFLWILSEDNSMHYLRHWDKTGAPTPNIEALAAHGITFDHAFSNAPVCSVARTTLITSCYAPRIGTQYHRRSMMAPMPDGVKMFPAYLRGAGYYTTNNSKTDYNATPGKDVWDESSNKATWKKRAEGQPFFHQVTYGTSHESSLHFGAEKMANVKTRTDPATVFVAPIHPDTPTFRYTYATYHDRIMDIDNQVGKVVAELEKDGLLEDTFIFYLGDHGGVLPRGKGYAYETGLHIPLAVRVPENFKGLVGDHKLGSRTGGFVSFVDFGPTLLNLAGLTPPDGIDGRPFLGKNVTAAELAERDEAFGYADRFDEKYDLVRTLRKGDFTYHRNYQPFNFDALQNDYRYKMIAYREWRKLYGEGQLDDIRSAFFKPRSPEALYNVVEDPYETKNLAADPNYADQLKLMRGRLGTIVRELPDLSFVPEPVMVDLLMDNPAKNGTQGAEGIRQLADIADLQILPFAEAKPKIAEALAAATPGHRYWALITCSAFGKEAAAEFGDVAKEIAADEGNDPLTRTRAAEFLGLTGTADPRPFIKAALKVSETPVATNLILNTAVLLQDGEPGYTFTLTKGDVNQHDRYIDARLAYLSGKPAPPKKRKR